jgi:selenocysteine-specific translation elongation factor
MTRERKHFAGGKIKYLKKNGMARDLNKDLKMFNCKQQDEINYVISLYPGHEKKVHELIHYGCVFGTIKYFTHLEVYQYIHQNLGLGIP